MPDQVLHPLQPCDVCGRTNEKNDPVCFYPKEHAWLCDVCWIEGQPEQDRERLAKLLKVEARRPESSGG